MFTNPQKNAESFQLMPGMYVADFGAGSGFYIFTCSPMVGENGKIYAVDIQKDVLSTISNEADKKNLHNVEVIWGDLEKVGGSRLSDNSLDFVIASNILFQIESKESFIKEVKRVLKPGKGRVAVIDWRDSFGGLGPENNAVVSKDVCKNLFLSSGFELDREVSDSGAHHYGLIFRK